MGNRTFIGLVKIQRCLLVFCVYGAKQSAGQRVHLVCVDVSDVNSKQKPPANPTRPPSVPPIAGTALKRRNGK